MSEPAAVLTSTSPVAVVSTVSDEVRLIMTRSPVEQIVLTGAGAADEIGANA